MKIVLGIIGGVVTFLGLVKLFAVCEAYRFIISAPLFDVPGNREMLNGQIGVAVVLCIIGGVFLMICAGSGKKKSEEEKKEKIDECRVSEKVDNLIGKDTF